MCTFIILLHGILQLDHITRVHTSRTTGYYYSYCRLVVVVIIIIVSFGDTNLSGVYRRIVINDRERYLTVNARDLAEWSK